MMCVFRPLVAAMVLALFSTTALRADPDACLTAPTRTCVFDLAIEVAEDQAPPHWVRAMAKIAILQESVGFPQSADTLATLIADMPERLPDPRDRVLAFYYLPAAPLRDGLPKAPRAAAAIASLLLDQAERSEGPARDGAIRTAAACFAYSADWRRTVEMTRSAAPYLRPKIVFAATRGLHATGNTAMLPELFELIVDRTERDNTKGMAVAVLASNGHFESAEELIPSIDAWPERRTAWITVMETRYEHQHFDAVRAIARGLEESFPMDGLHGVRSTLETIYARLGDEAKLDALIAGRATDSIGLDPDYLRALARMVNGDIGPILAYQEWIEAQDVPSYKVPDNKDIVEDYLGTGQTDLTPFLAYFAKAHPNDRSGRDVYDRVLFIGAKQAEQGDLEGAQTTFMGAEFIRETHMDEGEALDWGGSYVLALERLLVARGRTAEAVASAYGRRDSGALAVLATLIE